MLLLIVVYKSLQYNDLLFNYKVKTVSSYDEITPIFETITDQDLVLFDHTCLIYPQDQLVQHVENHALRRALFKKHPELIDPKQTEHVLSSLMLQAPVKAIEQSLQEQLYKLKEKKVPLLALAKILTGPYGQIERSDEWLYRQLKSAGIDFNNKEIPEELVFTTFAPFKHNHMSYYKGILCTHNRTKGEALGAYLDALSQRPRRVIIIDSSHKEVAELEKSCRERDITILAYCYNGAEKKYSPVLDIKRAVFQIDYLIKEGIWLSDSEATAHLAGIDFSYDPDYVKKKPRFTEYKAKLFLEEQAAKS